MVSPPQAEGSFHCHTPDSFCHTTAFFNLFSSETHSSAMRFSGCEEKKNVFSTSLIGISWDCRRAAFYPSSCISLLKNIAFPRLARLITASHDLTLSWKRKKRLRLVAAPLLHITRVQEHGKSHLTATRSQEGMHRPQGINLQEGRQQHRSGLSRMKPLRVQKRLGGKQGEGRQQEEEGGGFLAVLSAGAPKQILVCNWRAATEKVRQE